MKIILLPKGASTYMRIAFCRMTHSRTAYKLWHFEVILQNVILLSGARLVVIQLLVIAPTYHKLRGSSNVNLRLMTEENKIIDTWTK